MPYLEAPAASLQRMFGVADGDLPDAVVVLGQWGQRGYFERLAGIWPGLREVEEHTALIEADGRRLWVSVVFGAAMAATLTHFAVRLGARAVVQIGSMGGLATGWQVGDVLVPTSVAGRDGVSRQQCRGRIMEPDAGLTRHVMDELSAQIAHGTIRRGALVTTTTISLERPADITRWRRSGFAGVEMECAATLAMARYLGAPAAGAFVLVDNLAEGHVFYDIDDDQAERIRAAGDAVLRSSVAAVLRQLA
jgi:uridine phosphorylase